MRIAVTVLGPSWSSVDRVELFADGVKLREQPIAIERASHPGIKAVVTWDIPRPPHDLCLVAVASGPGVTAPFWAIPRPYQPTSRAWTPRVLGIANPVFLDGDDDGVWTSPKGYAERLVGRAGTEPARLLPALASHDEAVAAQAAALCQAAGRNVRGPEYAQRLTTAAEPVRRGFAAFAATLSDPPREAGSRTPTR
jgi:hypothetical protein